MCVCLVNIIYVSMDNGLVWTPLHEFLDVRTTTEAE